MNPLRIPGRFVLGLFGYLHEGGMSFTTVPERWDARWPNIVRMARMADEAGLDFLLPIARWKGVPGAMTHRLHSFETLTHAAALAGETRRIALLATVHTTLIHPVIAAKATVTIDHASQGRAGLNIVCGWNPDDFAMFGRTPLPHAERYPQAWEWFQVWSRLVAGVETPFDFDGRYFPGLKGLVGLPASVQPRPIVISAAFSPDGRAFAARTSDYLFTFLETLEGARAELDAITAACAGHDRPSPLGTIAVTHIVCRASRQEAQDVYDDYADRRADQGSVDYYLASRSGNATMPESARRDLRMRFAAGNGAYPLVGSPQDVAEGLIAIREAGFAGASISLLNYCDELPLIVDRVLPIVDRAGIRPDGDTIHAT